VKRSLLRLIKRCKLKDKPVVKVPDFQDVRNPQAEVEEWKRQVGQMERKVSQMAAKNEKVMDDNHYLRLELKRTRWD
jgi:hypothetical protein